MLPELSRIVVPIDFSHSAHGSLDLACRLAAERDAEVLVFHAFEAPMLSAVAMSVPAVTAAVGAQELHAKEQLDVLADSAQGKHAVKVTSVSRRGRPESEIVRFAHDVHADLVVICACGQSSNVRATDLGTVARAVLNQCECPVLLMPPSHRHVD